MDQKDVFIVGAGPSGLMMAEELLRHGLSCRIIDLSGTPTDKSKAIAIQARTLEILDHIGLAEKCLAEGLKITHFAPWSHRVQLADISFQLIDSPFSFILSLEQSKLERIFVHHLEKSGLKVEREVELISFKQDKDRVIFSLKNQKTGELEEGKARWLIGCDGAHSTIRKQMNLHFEGSSFPDTFSLADLEIKWKYPHDRGLAFIDENGILAAFPLKEQDRYRLIFQLPRSRHFSHKSPSFLHGEIPSSLIPGPTLEEAKNLVHRFADPEALLKNPTWMTHFHINSRMVSNYQEGRIFLVGDAAHIHSPVGGQGMNTGLQDAFNLAWKLSLIHREKATAALLESYHDERHFIGKNVLKGTEKASFFILLHSPILVRLRNYLIRIFFSIQDNRQKIACLISQIAIK